VADPALHRSTSRFSVCRAIGLFILGLPVLAIGTWIGWTVYDKLDEGLFRKGVLVRLLVSGIAFAV